MARGTQFLPLVTRLRSELTRSVSPAVGVDDLDELKQILNRTYAEQYDAHDWPHLRRIFPKKTLAAGEYYYDFPVGLNFERIEWAVVWYSGTPHRIERGIGFEEYASYDTSSDERSDPVVRWDVRDVDGDTQFEVWPVPATTQAIQFKGFAAIGRLVADSDVCLLDDDLIVLGAAAKLEPEDRRRREMQQAFAERMRVLQAQGARTSPRRQLGLNRSEGVRPNAATIRVS